MRPPVFAAAAAAVALLAGCTATGTPHPSSDAHAASPRATPTPSATVPPISADAMLVIRATATGPGGAQLQLQYQVHQTRPWNDLANSAVPKVFEADCPDDFTDDIFATQQWSFTVANIAATPAASTPWPSTAQIAVVPSGTNGWVVAREAIQNVDPNAKRCQGDKSLTASGIGGIALGLKGDGAAGAADQTTGSTGWTAQAWGVRVGAASGIQLSDCQITVTPLGQQYGAGSGSWSTKSDATDCEAGASGALG